MIILVIIKAVNKYTFSYSFTIKTKAFSTVNRKLSLSFSIAEATFKTCCHPNVKKRGVEKSSIKNIKYPCKLWPCVCVSTCLYLLCVCQYYEAHVVQLQVLRDRHS